MESRTRVVRARQRPKNAAVDNSVMIDDEEVCFSGRLDLADHIDALG